MRLLQKKRAKQGREKLETQEPEPETEPELEWLWHGFWVLSNRRQQGNPIPFGDIVAYMDFEGMMNEDNRELFVTVVTRLDDAFIKHANDKMKAELERAKAKSLVKRRR